MNPHRLYIPVLAILLVVLLFAAKVWINEREGRIRAEERDNASKAIIAQKDQSLAERDKLWQQQQQDFQRQIDGIKTVAQARQVLQPIIMPGTQPRAEGPHEQQVAKSELPATVQKDLPGAPDTKFSLLGDDQMIALAKREKLCQQTEAGLTNCQADISDWKDKFAASQKDVETWKTAAKGGNWLRRTLKIAVPLACAGGGAWLASKASKDSKSAAIGAVTAGGACALSFHF